MTYRNTGSTTWTISEDYGLGSQGLPFNNRWGVSFASLATSESIAPQQLKTFTFNITAPTNPGLHLFQWKMVKEFSTWFGDRSPVLFISVQGNESQFRSQNVPTSMTAGETRQVSVTFRNSGTTTWTQAGLYRLGSENPTSNSTWGTNRISLANTDSIDFNEEKTFTFNITAPSTPGNYNFQWRMVQDGVEWFGPPSTNAVIQVQSAPLPTNNSQFLSQNIPTTMAPGESRAVSLTFRNTGNTTWTTSGQYALGSQNPEDNSTWGVGRVPLKTNSIAPGQQTTFNFDIIAPMTPGNYNCQWRMVQDTVEWFGHFSPNIVIQVQSPTTNDSQFLSQVIPTTVMGIEEVRSVSLTFVNTGTTIWSPSAQYALGSQNPQDNLTWGIGRVSLESSSIAPGEEANFTFEITAPSIPGTYNFQWRVVQDTVEWFGDLSPNVVIQVQSPTTNDAHFISQNVPTAMTPGETRSVSLTFENTGTTTWSTAGQYKLGSQNPEDNMTWGTRRASLETTPLPSGQQTTFTFDITAPSTPGTYNFQWKMVQEFVEWFGSSSPNVTIQVQSVATNNSRFISQSVPTTLAPGETRQVSLTFDNTGTTTWSLQSLYRLSSQNPPHNSTWGINSVNLAISDPVLPTQRKTFTFNITAPNVPGNYNFQWRMQRAGISFGDLSPNVVVAVGASGPSPRMDSVSPRTMPVGSSATLRVRGANLDGGTFYIPEYAGSGRIAPTITQATVISGGTEALIQIVASHVDTEGPWMIAVQPPGSTTEEDVAAIDFRVVRDGPVIDAWTPSDPLAGGYSALLITGANLRGATVFSTLPGVEINSLNNAQDDALSGFLSVPPGTPPQQAQLIVRNHGVQVALQMGITDPGQPKSSHKMLKTSPAIYLQDMTFLLPEDRTRLESRGVSCLFNFSRTLFSQTFALRLNLLDELGINSPGVLGNLSVGETRRFGVLTIAIAARVYFTSSFSFCGGIGYQFCFGGSVGVQVPGIDGFVTEFGCCFPGGCLPRIRTRTAGSVTNVSVRTSGPGARCIALDHLTGPADGGEQYVDLTLFDCCAAPAPLLFTMEALLFDGTGMATLMRVVDWLVDWVPVCPPETPLIVIDPGHGGNDRGAKGPTIQLAEKDLSLDIGTRTAEMLAAVGYSVMMTRDDDSTLTLAERPEMARVNGASVFLSVHLNSARQGDCPSCVNTNGTETYWHASASLNSRTLATLVQDLTLEVTQLNDRGVKTTGVFGNNRSGLVVLQPDRHWVETAACLAEISFLCNPDEEERLNDPLYRILIATALKEAVVGYLNLERRE